MRSFEFYKNKLWKTAETGLIERQEPVPDKRKLLQSIIDGNNSKTDRLIDVFRLGKQLLPKLLSERGIYRHCLYDTDKLAVKPENYKFSEKVGQGGECNVYLLESLIKELPSLVMKINTLPTTKTDKLLELARRQVADYEKVKDIYKDCPELVPEEQTVIGPSLRNGRAAVINFQHFFGGKIRDIFSLNKAELEELASKNSQFQHELKTFVNSTIDNHDQTDEMIDLLGENNVAVVEQDGMPAVRILDPHIFYSTKQGNNKDIKERLEKRLASLNEFKEFLD